MIFKKIRQLILPSILLFMFGMPNMKNATFVTPEVRTKMSQKENENFRKVSEDSECEAIIDKYDFYRFDQQDMHYLVANTLYWGDNNMYFESHVIEGAGKVSIKVKNLESGSMVASGGSSASFYIQADTHYLIKIDISKLNDVQKSIVSMRIH